LLYHVADIGRGECVAAGEATTGRKGQELLAPTRKYLRARWMCEGVPALTCHL